MGLFRKCCGLLIIYLMLILSVGLSPVSAADINGTDEGDYVMADSDMIASITTDAPNGWWSMLPYWDFKTEYYKNGSGRTAPTDDTPIECGLLYGHDQAVNSLDDRYDDMVKNARNIIRISDEYALKHNETCYDSGSPTKWRHVPRQQLMQVYQNNYLNFKAAQKGLLAYYNSMTPIMGVTTCGGTIIGGICALIANCCCKITKQVAEALVVDGSTQVTAQGTGNVALTTASTVGVVTHTTLGTVILVISTVANWVLAVICGSISGDLGYHNSILSKIESKLGTLEADGLGIEAQTWLDRKSVNVINNWTEAIEKDLNISGNDTVDRGYVLDYYRLLGYDVINYTNTKTLYDKGQKNNEAQKEEEKKDIPPVENNNPTTCVIDNSTFNNSTVKPLPSTIDEVNNSTNKTLIAPVLTKKNTDLMVEFSKNHKSIAPTKTPVDNSGAEFLHRLSMDDYGIFPDWDPWVKPSDAPHMKSHYKWYQCFQAIWDAVKIVCFWIYFAIAMVVYAIYWLFDFLIIHPITVLIGLISFQDELTETADYLESLNTNGFSNDTNNVEPDVETGGYDVHINYVQVKVPVGNNSTSA
jgi:hypothetical protein